MHGNDPTQLRNKQSYLEVRPTLFVTVPAMTLFAFVDSRRISPIFFRTHHVSIHGCRDEGVLNSVIHRYCILENNSVFDNDSCSYKVD